MKHHSTSSSSSSASTSSTGSSKAPPVVLSANDAISSSSSSQLLGTYEATMAALSISQQPDPIHWMNDVTFREHRYRLLHHQCGTIGMVTVRLLQAAHLRRSHWSMLALGPVKLLGLSKAHGPVSSFCEFTLDFVDPHSCCQSDHSTSNYSNTNTNNTSNSNSNIIIIINSR